MTATTTTHPLPARPTSLWRSIAAFAAGAALATGATLAFIDDKAAEVGDRTPRPATVVSQPSAGYLTSADAAERRAIAAHQEALERCTDGPRSAEAAERCVSAVAANGD